MFHVEQNVEAFRFFLDGAASEMFHVEQVCQEGNVIRQLPIKHLGKRPSIPGGRGHAWVHRHRTHPLFDALGFEAPFPPPRSTKLPRDFVT